MNGAEMEKYKKDSKSIEDYEMIPVVSVVGTSGVGKTTLVEKLISIFTARGYKVGSIKFTRHSFDPDTEGKDTWRHTKAGAIATALVTPLKTAVFVPNDSPPTIDELAYKYYTEADIIIIEGGKEQRGPKIWLLGPDCDRPGCPAEELVALVTAQKVKSDTPVFDRDDAEAIADLIQSKFLKKVSRSEVRVWIDGIFLPMKPFIKAFVGQTVKGMLSSLRGGKHGERIHIKIGR
jgi:molybdopterin-guanine dinucleotide biosynthesis adapter protein